MAKPPPASDPTDVNHERTLARAFLELRKSVTQLKMALPDLSLAQILMLSGVVEQAKTEGLAMRQAPIQLKALEGFEGVEVKELTKAKTLTIHTGRGDAPAASVLAKLLAQHGGLTVRQIIDVLKSKGWHLNTTSDNPDSIIRMVLNRNEELFEAIALADRKVKYKCRKTPKSKAHPTQAKIVNGDHLLRALASLDKPISVSELGKKLNIDTPQALVPIMVSLRSFGAAKNSKDKDGTLLWTINVEKLRAYDAERGGSAFPSKNPTKLSLNGVSSHA